MLNGAHVGVVISAIMSPNYPVSPLKTKKIIPLTCFYISSQTDFKCAPWNPDL